MSIETALEFQRGEGQWSGVVLIERPPKAEPDSICIVTSAKTVAYGGKRAIYCKLPYKMFQQHFRQDDGQELCMYAEWRDGYLQFYERASKREYFLNASPMAAGTMRH